MKNVLENKFKFWCPVDISKGVLDPTTGEELWRLGGIASTSDEDSDGEFLDPKGFDINPLMSSGMVNWHHQSKTQPAAIIGEPVKGEIRPEGLYLEVDLYKNSSVARDTWELANVLEKNSKTRRLGFSIEGKVVKRKSNDKNHPDYKKISKAIITGVAVTHQPKNPKTFANIIKGEIDDFEPDEEKALDTESGAAVTRESLLGGKTYTKKEVIDIVIKATPTINLQDANKVYILIKKIADMSNKNQITDVDINKAYESLGLEAPLTDITKAADSDTEGGKTEKEPLPVAKKNTDNDDGDDSGDDGVAAAKQTKMNKGEENGLGLRNPLDRIEKAIADGAAMNVDMFRAVGVMVKNVTNSVTEVLNQNAELAAINKGLSEELDIIKASISELGGTPVAQKSITKAAAVEKTFAKANETDLEKGGGENEGDGVTAVSQTKHANAILGMLDQMLEKGWDDEISKGLMLYDANKGRAVLPSSLIQRMEGEFNVKIVK